MVRCRFTANTLELRVFAISLKSFRALVLCRFVPSGPDERMKYNLGGPVWITDQLVYNPKKWGFVLLWCCSRLWCHQLWVGQQQCVVPVKPHQSGYLSWFLSLAWTGRVSGRLVTEAVDLRSACSHSQEITAMCSQRFINTHHRTTVFFILSLSTDLFCWYTLKDLSVLLFSWCQVISLIFPRFRTLNAPYWILFYAVVF